MQKDRESVHPHIGQKEDRLLRHSLLTVANMATTEFVVDFFVSSCFLSTRSTYCEKTLMRKYFQQIEKQKKKSEKNKSDN